MKNENTAILLSAIEDAYKTWNKGRNIHLQSIAIRRKSGDQVSEIETFSLDEDKDGKVSKLRSNVNAKYSVELQADQQSAFGKGSKKALAFYYSLNRAMISAGGSADVLFAGFRMEAEDQAKAGRERAEIKRLACEALKLTADEFDKLDESKQAKALQSAAATKTNDEADAKAKADKVTA